MAWQDDLISARDNLAAELKAETARRKVLVDAGNPAPTTYSVEGRSVDWNGYLNAMLAQIRQLDETIQGVDTPFEKEIRGYSA